MSRCGNPEIPEPTFVSGETEPWEEPIPSFDEMDRAVLEACGYESGTPMFEMLLESVVSDDEDGRIFNIDVYGDRKLDGAVEEILKNEAFDRYWRYEIYGRLTDEDDGRLLEQWTEDFIGDEVRRKLTELKKGELLYYIDLFRGILSKSENEGALDLIDFNDPAFGKMPKVVRIF